MKEINRFEIISRLIQKQINGTEAAKQLDISVRHVKRLKAKVKKQGAQGLINGHRGKPSNRRMSVDRVEKIKTIIKDKYSDFGPTLAQEKLSENYSLKIGKETLRQLMISWGLWQPKPRKTNKEYRSWRPRKGYFGEMMQFDGSYHDWFEGRNKIGICCLLGSIDDATGKVTGLKFVAHEGVKPVFAFWKEYIEKHGKPLSIYLDRHSTYKQNQKSVLDDPLHFTQFERATKNLDIQLIHAHSPQAKGRVERLFGILQDRLVKELRLKNINTIDEANRFLEEKFIPEYNQKFSVLPQKKRNLHRSPTKIEIKNLDKVFSIHHLKVVNNDFTVSYQGRWFQLGKTQPTLVLRKDKIRIEERISGEIFISLRDKYLNFTKLPCRPPKIKDMKVIALTKTQPAWKPPLNHPWRKLVLTH